MTLPMLPSFFKILLNPSRLHLPLPPAFVRKHLKNKIPENPILQSASGGYSWRLKIKKVDNIYSFTDGWNKVVEDTQLVFGDFLVFWLVDQSTFKVSIFGTNGCGKDFPSKINVEHGDDEDKKGEEEQDNDEGEEEEEQDDEGEEEEEQDDDEGGEEEEQDDDEGEEEEEQDDDDDDEGEEEEEDDGGEGGSDDDDGGGGGESGDINRDETDPFFTAIISKFHKFYMRLPMKFVRFAGIHIERIIAMKNVHGKEWRLSLHESNSRQYKRFYLCSGWSEFRRANELSEGDECVIKFLRSEDKLCLAKVTRKRVIPAKQPAVKVPATEVKKRPAGQPPRTEVVKRSRGRPRNRK